MRTFEDPIEDLHEDLGKIFEDRQILVKIFKDLSFSCQDLQGSLKILLRSSRIFHFLAKIFKDLSFSCQVPWRSCLDLQRSWQELWRSSNDLLKNIWGSSKFLSRSSRIFHFLAKIFMDLSFSCQDPKDLVWSFKDHAKNFDDPLTLLTPKISFVILPTALKYWWFQFEKFLIGSTGSPLIEFSSLFAPLICLILCWYWKEKFCLGHSWELKG